MSNWLNSPFGGIIPRARPAMEEYKEPEAPKQTTLALVPAATEPAPAPATEPAPVPAVVQGEIPSAEDQLAAQFYSYHIGTKDITESTKSCRAILAGDGAYMAKNITVNGNKGVVITPTSKIPGLPKLGKGSIGIEITNKIPRTILRQLLADFQGVCKSMSTEAAAQVFKKPDGEYEIYYPEQEVSGGTASYRNDQDNAEERWGNKELVLEVHSHNTMGAFFSSTDDRNEKRPGIYGVFGMLHTGHAAFVGRFRYESLSQAVSLKEVFDIGETSEQDALALVGLPEPSPVLMERAKRSNPLARSHTHDSMDYRRFPFGTRYDLDEDHILRMGMGLEDSYYSEFAKRFDRIPRATTPALTKGNRKTAKTQKTPKAKKSGKTPPMIDSLWVVSAMDNPDQIRRLIIALDDKLKVLNKNEQGGQESE